VKIDRPLLTRGFEGAAAAAHTAEELGFDGVFTFEGPHTPFFPLVAAAGATASIALSTGVAIALARNPMIVASESHDLHVASGGRFSLGLGPQVRAHIEKRFGAPATRPAARMRDFVGALRAIWACWNDGVPLRYEGEFYRHTLMTPMFHPGASPHGPPPVLLAGVGPAMTRVAAEVADGIVLHPFHTRRFLEQVTLPALTEGLRRAGRDRAGFQIVVQVLAVTGTDDDAYRAAREATRAQIAFYASTPSYAGVLRAEGAESLQPRLRELSKQGRWNDMAAVVEDQLLDRVAICGPPAAVGREIVARYHALASRIALASPFEMEPAAARILIDTVHSASGSAISAQPSARTSKRS
jgi:probable F420-dependent oxidoreductase